jgi:phage terminase large subunit-like protein
LILKTQDGLIGIYTFSVQFKRMENHFQTGMRLTSQERNKNVVRRRSKTPSLESFSNDRNFMKSPAQLLAEMSEEEREEYMATLSPAVLAQLKYAWDFWARPNQLPPEGEWNTWLVLAGRGFGKTRMGSEWIRRKAKENPGCRIALIAETAADARDVMILGDSGLVNVDPELTVDSWSPTNRRLSWPNGSQAWCYNATEPDQLRGPQHHFAWIDELAKFRHDEELWDQVQFGLRLGQHPQCLATTTPLPKPLIRKLVNDTDTVITRGATLDNQANLAKNTIKQLYERYGNTRLGRQELEGAILDDMPGALWTHEMIDNHRKPIAPEMERIIVAVDPAASSGEEADETGIVAVGIARDDDGNQRGYVLADRSLRGTPDEWASAAVKLFHELDADRIVAEKNQGGEMVEAVLRAKARDIPLTLVHASRGKIIRAEPISALYEQGRVHHVGRFDKLEDQMCLFTRDVDRRPGKSPDRVDALVWGLTSLFDKITSRRRRNDPNEDEYKYKTAEVRSSTNIYRDETDTSWMAG